LDWQLGPISSRIQTCLPSELKSRESKKNRVFMACARHFAALIRIRAETQNTQHKTGA
jgi:hypothetical protein